MKLDIKINKTIINFDNLFDGNPVLGTLLFHYMKCIIIHLSVSRNL